MESGTAINNISTGWQRPVCGGVSLITGLAAAVAAYQFRSKIACYPAALGSVGALGFGAYLLMPVKSSEPDSNGPDDPTGPNNGEPIPSLDTTTVGERLEITRAGTQLKIRSAAIAATDWSDVPLEALQQFVEDLQTLDTEHHYKGYHIWFEQQDGLIVVVELRGGQRAVGTEIPMPAGTTPCIFCTKPVGERIEQFDNYYTAWSHSRNLMVIPNWKHVGNFFNTPADQLAPCILKAFEIRQSAQGDTLNYQGLRCTVQPRVGFHVGSYGSSGVPHTHVRTGIKKGA